MKIVTPKRCKICKKIFKRNKHHHNTILGLLKPYIYNYDGHEYSFYKEEGKSEFFSKWINNKYVEIWNLYKHNICEIYINNVLVKRISDYIFDIDKLSMEQILELMVLND